MKSWFMQKSLKKIEEDNNRLMTEKKIFESKIVDLQSPLDKLSSTCKDEMKHLKLQLLHYKVKEMICKLDVVLQ